MSGFVQARANSAAKRREAASGPHTNAIAGAEQAAPQALSLLQMRQALDRSPRVQSHAALQRALDRSAAAGKAPPKRKEKPALQMKRMSVDGDALSYLNNLAVIQRKYSVSSVLKFAELKIGRAQNAGIVDEKVEVPASGLKFTQHFHCNGWEEKKKEFDSFTGTFVIDGNATVYHYTITEAGGAWVGAEPPSGKIGMKARTEQKLSDLTKA